MGVFTRLRDIVSSNLNAMLDRAEDPEKLIKLMIQEMEDTLVEIKASCAGAMATGKRIGRDLDAARAQVTLWAQRAELALRKDREDLAREALLERRRSGERVEALTQEEAECTGLVEHYQAGIQQLETKLASAREKHRMLIRRHLQARQRRRAETGLRRAETSDAWVRFEQFRTRIDRMEAGADLVNGARPPVLDETFAALDTDEEIEAELRALQARLQRPAAAAETQPDA